MGLSQILAVLVLLPALTLARAEPPPTAKADPKGFLEVPHIGITEVNGKISFNEGRQYAIAVNKHFPNAKEAKGKMESALGKQKLLDQIVFKWFGKEPPTKLNLLVGNKVPVEMAQAVVAAYAARYEVPVYITMMTEDEELDHTRCVYVGAVVDSDIDPVTPEKIKELLKPGLTAEQFAKLLPKKKD